jgi:hypothetical protein
VGEKEKFEKEGEREKVRGEGGRKRKMYKR